MLSIYASKEYQPWNIKKQQMAALEKTSEKQKENGFEDLKNCEPLKEYFKMS
jgi:hypothetical protein